MGELTDKIKGTVKEALGEAKQHSNDPETRAEGTMDKLDGKIDKAKGSVKGAFGDKI
ncbi:MAG: CsbD family protein [Erythrobacter sp.]|nr:CsbD family protein [Erythrobacter sp.]